MLDAYIPDGALKPDGERKLLSKLTDLLLEHEGADPKNEAARSIAWAFLHRPEIYVAGAPAEEPRYRFVCQVPEGQYDAERREAVTREMTAAVAEAEGGKWPAPEARVWVFTHEVPDGVWGALGRSIHLPDIYEYVVGGAGREPAEQRLAERRRQEATELLEAAGVEAGAVSA